MTREGKGMEMRTNGRSHLTAEQMEAMLRDSPYRRQSGRHLEECDGCRDEVENLAEVLGVFRASCEVYATRKQTVQDPVGEAGGRRVMASWRWSIAAGALACGMLAVPVVHRMAAHAGGGKVGSDPAPARTAEMSDEALLEGVQDDLASYLPAPLETLAAASSTKDSGGGAGGSRGSQAGRAAQP